ncbi:MAG: hypothetical protein KGL19_02480 [Bacteroidota bacterium]|nr:hypothetical protein [Bacteroidota bacterium]
MKTKILLSAILALAIVCMSFVPTKHVQKKVLFFRHHVNKYLDPSINATPGPGAKEFTIEVSGADPSKTIINVAITFNGGSPIDTFPVTLNNGYGFLDQQTSFTVTQTDVSGWSY